MAKPNTSSALHTMVLASYAASRWLLLDGEIMARTKRIFSILATDPVLSRWPASLIAVFAGAVEEIFTYAESPELSKEEIEGDPAGFTGLMQKKQGEALERAARLLIASDSPFRNEFVAREEAEILTMLESGVARLPRNLKERI